VVVVWFCGLLFVLIMKSLTLGQKRRRIIERVGYCFTVPNGKSNSAAENMEHSQHDAERTLMHGTKHPQEGVNKRQIGDLFLRHGV
jgi:hypothetical protein